MAVPAPSQFQHRGSSSNASFDASGHPDEVDKEFVRMFQTYLDDIETLVHENSLGLKKDAHASKSLVKEIKKVVLGELEAEVEEDRRDREEREQDRKMGLDDGHDRTAAQEDASVSWDFVRRR